MSYTLLDDIADEVEVPADGTLSRVLFKDEMLRPVAFAYDAGQELNEHTASLPVIVQVISGALIVEVEGERFPDGTAVVIAPRGREAPCGPCR